MTKFAIFAIHTGVKGLLVKYQKFGTLSIYLIFFVQVNEINRNVAAKQKDCEADLKKAEPALAAAQHALNTLNKVFCPFKLL